MRVRIAGTTLEGKDPKKTVLLPLGDAGTGAQRMARAGLRVMVLPTGTQVMSVGLNSAADKAVSGRRDGTSTSALPWSRDTEL